MIKFVAHRQIKELHSVRLGALFLKQRQMTTMIWFSSAVIAREPMVTQRLTDPVDLTNPLLLFYSLISLGLTLQSVSSSSLPISFSTFHPFSISILLLSVLLPWLKIES